MRESSSGGDSKTIFNLEITTHVLYNSMKDRKRKVKKKRRRIRQ